MPRPPQQPQNNINLNSMAKINIQAGPSTGGGTGGNLQLLAKAAMSTTLTAVADTSDNPSQLKLASNLTQVAGTLQIHTDTATYIDAEDASGNNRFTISRDPASQLVTVDFASVPTALTTPVGAIRTATDGVTLANVLTFLENGNIGGGTDSPGSKLDIHSSGAIVAQFNKTVSGNSYIQQLTAGAAKWKHGFTTATGAFDIIDDVNALTRLSVLNTGQLKLNAYTSTSAFTGTTAGFLAFDATGNILSVASPATSPSGVAGSVQFSDGTNFASDATKFFWDNTNKRLGNGTNTPTATSHIKGSGATSATTSLLVQNSGGTAAVTVVDDSSTGIYARTQLCMGYDATPNNNASIRFLILGSGKSYIDGYSEGTTKAQNYALVIGSRANNTGGSISGNTTQENGTQVIFGYESIPASAQVAVNSTTRGFMPPRMTTAQKNAIVTPAAGLMVYDTTLNKLCVYTTAWETITSL